MTWKPIYSRMFLEKVLSWPEPLRRMAFEAAKHVCLDPSLNDYKRSYLTPYRQKHPTANHQYTLYFLEVLPNEIFFAWINDTSCLHDTRNQLTDPCLREFNKLRGRNLIEMYDASIHKIVFEVHPDKLRPFRCRSTFLNGETTLNSYTADGSEYIGHAFNCDEPNFEIAKVHVNKFLNRLYDELASNNIPFEFQFSKLGHQREVSLLTSAFDPQKWIIVDDVEDFILKNK